MSYCGGCLHREVCGSEGVGDESLTFCKDRLGWIPVSKGLPEENKTVIASTMYGVYPETRYTEEYGWEWAYEAGADYWKTLAEVVAWMPLPEPYKTESEDKFISANKV